jgi:RimJ/RimL family protein N-acetyltransferase
MTEIIETPRLTLREVRAGDLDDLAGMVGDPDQMRFSPRPKTREESAAWIDRNRSLYREHGYGFWVVESRSTMKFLGYCGIRPLALRGVPETEIGWHVTKECWNQGFATEAAVGVRDAAFARFSQTRLIALVAPSNLASRRVAAKIGMREEDVVEIDHERYQTYVGEMAQRATT